MDNEIEKEELKQACEKKKKIGKILLFVGLGILVLLIILTNAIWNGKMYFWLWAVIPISWGLGLLGQANKALTPQITPQNQNVSDEYYTVCKYCNKELKAKGERFSIHRNFPEGFVYCSCCRKPLSFTEFKKVEENVSNKETTQNEE